MHFVPTSQVRTVVAQHVRVFPPSTQFFGRFRYEGYSQNQVSRLFLNAQFFAGFDNHWQSYILPEDQSSSQPCRKRGMGWHTFLGFSV